MAKAKKVTASDEQEAVTLPKGQVIVIATAEAKHLKEGKEYELNSIAAQTLINKGFATLKK